MGSLRTVASRKQGCAPRHVPSCAFVETPLIQSPQVLYRGSSAWSKAERRAHMWILPTLVPSQPAPAPLLSHLPTPSSTADLTNYTNGNIKGFNSFASLSAYATMLKKPQCVALLALGAPSCLPRPVPPHTPTLPHLTLPPDTRTTLGIFTGSGRLSRKFTSSEPAHACTAGCTFSLQAREPE